ncbi:MAG: hypothetical protein EBZ77_11015 [Chitinophagia bacterium]|nr:hypothetical protein [Chitinophagia bacterium]
MSVEKICVCALIKMIIITRMAKILGGLFFPLSVSSIYYDEKKLIIIRLIDLHCCIMVFSFASATVLVA